ncbi:MAG: carbohydrate ABC transporter permease [Aggregatilineales bacterium]
MASNTVASRRNITNTHQPSNPFNYRKLLSRILSYLFGIGVSLIFIYPIIWLVSVSLKPSWEIYRAPLKLIPSEIQWNVYTEVFNSTPIGDYLLNSMMYAFGGSAITLFFSIMTAYGLSRYLFRGKRTLMLGLLGVQLLPNLVRIIPLFVMMNSLDLINTRHGLILLYGAGGIAYGTWFLKGYFDTIPIELDEAAQIDGASRFRVIWQILLPSIVPGIAALLILQFIAHWNDFAVASVLIRNPNLYPLTVGTFNLIGPDESDFRLLASAALINIVPVVIVFSVLQRFLVSGLSAGAVKR